MNTNPTASDEATTNKAIRFRELHRGRAFVIPNPWDIGSAQMLAGLGFPALATTSSGFAQSLGRGDGEVGLEEKLAHCRALCHATAVPISADLENGFTESPAGVAQTVRAAAATGLAGGSIEDFTGNPAHPIYDATLAAERIAAAVEAADGLDRPFLLTARAENLLHGIDDLDDTIRRLQAFEQAGAHVLYAPGLRSLEQVRAVAGAVTRPINVLATLIPGATLENLADAGAQRLSIGGALARAVAGLTVRAGTEMLETGRFSWLNACATSSQIDGLLERGATR